MKTLRHIYNFTLLLGILFVGINSAQGQLLGFKIKGASFNMGVEQDMVHNLDANYFSDMANTDFSAAMSNENVSSQYFYSGICENKHYRGELLLAPVNGSPVDLRFSLSYIPNRVDALSYHSNDRRGGYINVNSYTDEVSVGLSLMRHVTLGNTIRFYGGLGTNFGYIFDNDMYIDGDLDMNVDDMGFLNTGSDALPEFNPNDGYTYQEQDGPNGISQRLFLKGGVALRLLDRVELGLNVNYGYGYRKFFDGPMRATNLVGAGFSLAYSIE